MIEDFKAKLMLSDKITSSDKWDALYKSFPVVIALTFDDLESSFLKLNNADGYSYIATWRKNLFTFNQKLLSKRCGLIDENANLLKAARLPKK